MSNPHSLIRMRGGQSMQQIPKLQRNWSNYQLDCMAKHEYAFDAPNRHPSSPKSRWNPSNFAQISRLRVCLVVRKVKCEELWVALRKNQWNSVLEAMSVERRRRRCWRGERGTGVWGGARGRGRRKGSDTIRKIPLSIFFSFSLFFDSSWSVIGTASLVHIPNSKPESLIRPSIDYSFPNISRFDFNKPRN